MKLGAALPYQWGYHSKSTIDELSRIMEDLGLDSLWVPDHIIMPDYDIKRMGGTWYEILSLASYLAGRTRKITIGLDVLIVPYREPVFTAKALATLDNLCEGRLIVGVGTGYVVGEFDALAVPVKERGARHDEYLRVFKEIWTQKDAKFQGRFVRFSDIRTDPKPVQKPHPPIWVGGNSDAAIKRAVELGDGWHPVGISLAAVEQGIAKVNDLAKKAGRKTPIHLSYSGRATQLTDGPPIPSSAEQPRQLLDGNIEQVLEDLRGLRKLGCGHVVFRFGRVDSNKEQMTKEMELLARRILSEVRRWK